MTTSNTPKSNTPKPATERELDIEGDPQPQDRSKTQPHTQPHTADVPEEDDPEIKNTEEQPS